MNGYCVLFSYRGNATRLSKLMRDELLPGKEVAAYWIEHVIRHGTKHLQPAGRDMPFYQRHLLDVFFFIFSVVVIFLILMYKIVKWCALKLRKPSSKKRKVK